MKKRILFRVLSLTLLCSVNPCLQRAWAQDCPEAPAPCSENPGLYEDEARCTSDYILHSEYEMQQMVRKQVRTELQRICGLKKWSFYEQEEWTEGESGPGNDPNKRPEPLEAIHRGPHPFYISFIVIVNQDSIDAWKAWIAGDLQSKANSAVQESVNAQDAAAKDALLKTYMDSMNYYSAKQVEYVSSRSAAYQEALKKNDQHGMDQHEAGLKKISDKVNYFIDKINARNEQLNASAHKTVADLQDMRTKQTLLFRNASLIRVTFQVNPISTTACDADTKLIKTLHIPDSYYGVVVHQINPPGNVMLSSFTWATDNAVVLFGYWKKGMGTYYESNFQYNAHVRDQATIKKIPSEKIQTVAVHVEGRADYIDAFLKEYGWNALTKWLTKI